MNQTLSEVLELREYAEGRLTTHLAAVNAAEGEDRKKVFNERLIAYIAELNTKCKEINGEDCEGRFKSSFALINEYQHKFMSRYRP